MNDADNHEQNNVPEGDGQPSTPPEPAAASAAYPPPPQQPAGGPPPPPMGQPNAFPPPPPAGPAYNAQTVPGDLMNPSTDEKNWAMFAHLSGFVAGLVASAIGMPMLGFLGPLVIYLMKKDQSPFVADQAKEALNFYISVSIIALGLFLLSLTVILLLITIPLLLVLGLGALILSIMAAIKASNGELYRYPLTLRLIK